MESIGKIVVLILSWLVLFGEIIAAGLLVSIIISFFSPKGKTIFNKISKLVEENYVACVFIVALVATAGSPSLSEIASFVPFKLCWFQRILMYPQVIIA